MGLFMGQNNCGACQAPFFVPDFAEGPLVCPHCGQTQSNPLAYAEPRSGAVDGPVGGDVAPAADAETLQNWFSACWILYVVSIPLTLIIVGIATMIISYVYGCKLFHRLWTIIPVQHRKTTPGKAVGFLFIPFFNLYWVFVAYYGLAKALNAHMQRNGIQGPRVEEGTVMTCIILGLCSIIPYVGIITSIISIIYFFITFKQMKDAGIAILNAR